MLSTKDLIGIVIVCLLLGFVIETISKAKVEQAKYQADTKREINLGIGKR